MPRTEIVSISGLLVFIPRDSVVLVQVIICPHLRHVFIHVTLLDSFDPVFEFGCGDVTVSVAVYSVYDFPKERQKTKIYIH